MLSKWFPEEDFRKEIEIINLQLQGTAKALINVHSTH